ncbi:MAG: non-homologous end-joining DNA ligase [Actinomycetia bacterium]|nr:non-homologous end-joining DNA ligase [Actinomycetes bacterium]
MKALLGSVIPDVLGQVVCPFAVRLARVDGMPVELRELRLAAELTPNVYRPGLSVLLAENGRRSAGVDNLAMGETAGSVSVGGRTLRVTSPNRIVYPGEGVTKAAVIGYYVRMAERMLPHLRRRPVTRIRWPGGVTEPPFFEKQLPNGAPDWIETIDLTHSDGTVTYSLAHEPAALAWFAQQNALELHVPQWRWHGVGPRVDRLVLDLDPGPRTGLAECAELALWMKGQLDSDGLENVPVTSGSKGIHVYARWRASDQSQSTSEYAKSLADSAVEAFPSLATASMTKVEREGKVLIDWSQNSPSKTTITPYSLRGRDRPFVAAPRAWGEVADAGLSHLLMSDAVERLDEPDPLAVLL